MSKTKEQTYKTGYVANWIGQHENTVRDWSARFEDMLSKGANAGRRRYVLSDVETLATIADYRQQGINLDEIGNLLAQGKRIESLPPEPTPEDTEARRNVQIVHIPETERLLEIQRYELRIQSITDERDNLIQKLETTEDERDTLQLQVNDLDKQLSVAQNQLETERKAHQQQITLIQNERKPAQFWLAVIVGIAISVTLIVLGLTVYFAR